MLHQNKRSKKSKSDNWYTPKPEAKALFKKHRFYPELDVCATNNSSICNWYIDRFTNALKVIWKIKGRKVKCFCNPPNKQLGKFIARCYFMYKILRIETMLIAPLNTQTSRSWWENVQRPKKRGEKIFVEPMDHRISFMFNGKGSSSSINGYCVVIFGRKQK